MRLASKALFVITALVVLLTSSPAKAAETDAVINGAGLDTVWVLMAAFLVFIMQAGFGMVEAGFIRSKNACNILTKNFMDYCTASLMFFLVGYALMFGGGNALFGTSGFAMVGVAILVLRQRSHQSSAERN